MEILAGFVIGFLGSLHCAGMCGPLVTAFAGRGRGTSFALSQLGYHGGRTATYVTLGLAVGLVGAQLQLAGLQRIVSVATGLIMISVAFWPAITTWSGRMITHVLPMITDMFGDINRRNTFVSRSMLGALNGLLPCGLVYVALAGALGTGDSVKGAFFMLMFGVGTLPVLLMLPLVGRILTPLDPRKRKWIIKAGVLCVAVLLILRGLSLGIPMLSPDLAGASVSGATHCH